MKTLMSFFVFSALVLGSIFSFQEWKKDQSVITFTNVEQLSYETSVQKLSAPEGKTLVPVGAVLGVNDINIISYTYLVKMENDNKIEVIPTNVFLTKDNEVYDGIDFLNFEYSIELVHTTQYRVTVDITLNMPTSEIEYNLISGSSISFQFIFKQL